MRASRLPITPSILAALLFASTATAEGGRAEVEARFGDFFKARNRLDAKAMAEFCAEDVTLVTVTGKPINGKGKVREFWATKFKTIWKGTRVEAKPTAVQFVSDGVAIVDIDMLVIGLKGPPKGRLLKKVPAVVVKKDGKWWVKAFRPYVPFKKKK